MIGIAWILVLIVSMFNVNKSHPYSKHPSLAFYARRKYEVIKAKTKLNYLRQSSKESLLHARILAGIEHPMITMSVFIFGFIGTFVAITCITGSIEWLLPITISPVIILSGVQAKEILKTGVVEAYDSEFGATNNSAKLQAAIDYCTANGRREIYLGNEAWALATKVSFPVSTGDWYLTGNNREVTILTSTINGDNVIEAPYSAPNRVEGITFSRFKIQGGGAENDGFYCKKATPVVFKQITVSDVGRHGINLREVYQGLVESCHLDTCLHSGMYIEYCNALTLIEVLALYCTSFGIYFYNYGYNNTCIGCVAQASVCGITLRRRCTNNTIIACYCEGNTWCDYYIFGEVGVPCDGNNILYCYANGGELHPRGIVLQYANHNNIHANYLRGFTTACVIVSYNDEPCDRNSLLGNSIGLPAPYVADTFLVINANGTNTRVGINNYVNVTTILIDNGTDTILPSVTVPFAWTDNGAVEFSQGIQVDGAGEGAGTAVVIPDDLNEIIDIKVFGSSQNADADGMLATFLVEGGASNEPRNTNTHTFTSLVSDTLNFIAQDVMVWTLAHSDLDDFLAKDMLNVQVTGVVAAGDDLGTDCIFSTIQLRYV